MNQPLSDSDNALLRAWRRGELDERARAAFETRLFFEPALVDAANGDLDLEQGLREHRQAAPPARTRAPLRRSVEWLVAAGLGAAVVLPLTLPTSAPDGVSANIEWVELGPRRSVGGDAMLVAPRADAELIAIEVAVALPDGSPATVRVEDGSGRPVLEVPRLRVKEGAISFAFARDALAGGAHTVLVLGDDGAPISPPREIRYAPN